jgi:phage-related protein
MNDRDAESKGWRIVYYVTKRGHNPVKEFLNNLPKGDRAVVMRNLALLQEFGLQVGVPLAKAVSGRSKLWELRVRGQIGAIRIFYFAYTGRLFVLLHGIVKKGRRTPKRELDVAERRMQELLEEEVQS